MSRIVAIIPARGGSKSLPKKNIRLLNGKPLISYTINYANNCDLISKAIVSTDSIEIAEIAKVNGAEVPFIRPSYLANDDTRDYPFMRHALEFLEDNGEVFDIYILLRPTSPIRPRKLIERAIDILNKHPDATSVRSVTRIKEHPYRAWKLTNEGSVTGFITHIDEPYNIPRQELPELYFQTGDIEAVRRETILAGSVSGDKVYPLLIAHDEMVDIDEVCDFQKAEEKLR